MTWGIVATMAATLVRDVRLPKAREEWYTCAMKNTVSVAPRSVGEAELLPLPGAVTNAKWRAHGAFEDAFYIRATNWWARMPDGRWMDRLRILSSGGFRARGVGGGAWTNYPPPFTQKLSLAPEANWPLLDRDSSFWHATTPSNTLVVSWIGGLYARSHTNLVDFQAEIFNDGSLDYRYADRTEHFAASLPFDLDGDGLENSVDPDPLTAGPDAHGTNAEWYNTVCSNVLEAVASGSTGTTGILPVDGDSVLTWRADVNSNAYYFVDVTRPCADLLHRRPRLAPRQSCRGRACGRHEPRAAPHRSRLLRHVRHAIYSLVPHRLHPSDCRHERRRGLQCALAAGLCFHRKHR